MVVTILPLNRTLFRTSYTRNIDRLERLKIYLKQDENPVTQMRLTVIILDEWKWGYDMCHVYALRAYQVIETVIRSCSRL